VTRVLAAPMPRIDSKLLRRAGALTLAALAAGLLAAAGAGAAVSVEDVSYDLDSPVADPNLNALDIYTPDGVAAADARPVVVYVHGGGWRAGDKANQIAKKVNLFTGAGYVFVSVNYRLSPQDTGTLDPGRIKFPDHPHDVGEAIGWLSAHVAAYGGDPTRLLLIGHSAGAHLVSLVSTDPSYIEAYGVQPFQLIGTVSLDTDAFDVTAQADPSSPAATNPGLFWNAFGTPAENAATGSWAAASPIAFADQADPRFLLVTSQIPRRVSENRAIATALGQDPAGVLSVPYDHEGINDAVGAAADPAGETAAIISFLTARVGDSSQPPKPKLSKHPRRRLKTSSRRVEVRFRFSSTAGLGFECRLDHGRFKSCRSPRTYRVARGRHRFRVRAVSASGRPGAERSFEFRVVRQRR
jgi:arylformamidase